MYFKINAYSEIASVKKLATKIKIPETPPISPRKNTKLYAVLE
jgi:hypothetical protein